MNNQAQSSTFEKKEKKRRRGVGCSAGRGEAGCRAEVRVKVKVREEGRVYSRQQMQEARPKEEELRFLLKCHYLNYVRYFSAQFFDLLSATLLLYWSRSLHP